MNVGSTRNQLSKQGWIKAAIVDWENGSQKKDIKYVGQVIAFQILHHLPIIFIVTHGFEVLTTNHWVLVGTVAEVSNFIFGFCA